MRILLTEIKNEEEGTIVEIFGGRGMTSRLYSLGIMEGKKIKKISHQIMGGPVVVQVGRTRVAIGRGMARRILVEIKIEKQL